jgi:hypothetical protein
LKNKPLKRIAYGNIKKYPETTFAACHQQARTKVATYFSSEK